MKVPVRKFEILGLIFIGIVIFTIVFTLFQKIILLKSLDLALLDEFIFLNGQRSPDDNVVIIALDDSSCSRFGNSNLILRKQYVKLIRNLSLAGVKTIVFDILFARQMDPQVDSLLAHVTDSTQNVIHCFKFSEDTLNAQLIRDEGYQKYAIEVINSEKIAITWLPYATFPNKKFIGGFDHAGTFTVMYDPDNKERRISLLIKYEGLLFPALALSTLLNYFDVSEKSVEIESNFWGKYLVIKAPDRFIKIPINSAGQVLLNYYGFVEQFEPIPLWKIMDLLERIKKNGSENVTLPSLTGKIVLVGTFETGVDKHRTPFSVVFPGVALHATLISNVLQGDLITEADWKINASISAMISLLLFCTFFYHIRKYSKPIWMFAFLPISLMLLLDLASYFIIFRIYYIWLKVIQINGVFIVLLIVLLFYEKGYRLKKVNRQINRLRESLQLKSNELRELNKNVYFQTEQLKTVDYFTNQLSTMLQAKPVEPSKSYEEILPMLLDNLRIMKEKLTQEIHNLKIDRERLEKEKEELKSEKERYEQLIVKPPEPAPKPIIDKYQIAREIGAAYHYFKTQHKDGFLEGFSFSNMIAVPSFVNEKGEDIKTEMGKILERIKRISRFDSSVLITGESGTGKELVAKAIHQQSKRANKPMVTVNCPAIQESLLESELFGHVKGAYTGAFSDRKGAFESANGSTIFLDEIGEFKLDLQAKLLRVLQERAFQKVGSDKTIQVDVRIITATNKDLEKCIENNEFRGDLYYRLKVIEFPLPPLRKRKHDIPFLIQHFLTKFNEKHKQEKSFSAEAIMAMMCYDWPVSNIREVENMIERLVVEFAEDVIDFAALPEEIQLAYRNIFDVHGWQQIEEEAQTRKDDLLEACKRAIKEDKIDRFLRSTDLELGQKIQPHCYDYFKVYLNDIASSFPEDKRTWLARKMIVQMQDELFQWRKDEKIGKSEAEYPKIEKLLGRSRREINNWRKELEQERMM